jgi:hypothetical protein
MVTSSMIGMPRAKVRPEDARRSLQNTGPPFSRTQSRELITRHNLELRSHGVMSRAAKFPAHCLVVTGARELKFRQTDGAWQSFHGVIGTIQCQRMHGISARDLQMDWHSCRNKNAMWNEKILLRNHAHGHRAIRVLLGSKVVLDKLSGEVKR